MTKEIWAAVIIAIAQIIVMVVIGWWQINIAKQLAKPEEKQEKNKNNLLEMIANKLSKYDLHIIIPLILNILIITVFIHKNGVNIFIVPIILWAIISLFIQVIFSYLFSIIKTLLDIIKQIKNILLCHHSILIKLTDKPCKDVSECKFDN